MDKVVSYGLGRDLCIDWNHHHIVFLPKKTSGQVTSLKALAGFTALIAPMIIIVELPKRRVDESLASPLARLNALNCPKQCKCFASAYMYADIVQMIGRLYAAIVDLRWHHTGSTEGLNFIPLWEWTWCHCVFCVRQNWRVRTVVSLQDDIHVTTNITVEVLCAWERHFCIRSIFKVG